MKVKQELTRKYYKYVAVESSWTQPVLSSNGTIGTDNFAVTASSYNERAYYPFRGSGNTSYWIGSAGNYLIMYSDVALRVAKIGIRGHGASSTYVTNFTLSGSNDNISWTDLGTFSPNTYYFSTFSVNNNSFYKYYKLTVNSVNSSGNIEYLELTAIQQTISIVEGTADDYDFYEETQTLNAFENNNTYKALKF